MGTQKVERIEHRKKEINSMLADWEKVKLREICELKSGGNAPQGEEYFKNGKYPFVRVQHFDGTKNYVDKWDLINDKAVKVYKLKLFPKDSIVFPKSGASIRLEKRALLPFDCFVVSHLAVLIPDRERCDPRFLLYLLKTVRFTSRSGGTTLPYLNLSNLEDLQISLPPLIVQQKIALVLSKIQQAIEHQDKIIEATKNLKKSLMHKLFTEGIGHTEFKDTEIGRMPKTWKIEKLGDVARLTSGGTPSRKVSYYFGGSIPWVKSGELEDNVIFDTKEKITEEGLRNSSAKIFPKGTLLIAMYGATVGKTGILGVEAATNQAVCAVFPKNNSFSPEFLRYYIIFARAKLLSERFGGAQPNISQTILRNISIPLPSIPEQREIAHILSSTDRKIDIEERKKIALQQLFKTMLHKLMTGEIRVKDLDLSVSHVN